MARSGHCTRGFEMEASSGRFRVRPIVVDFLGTLLTTFCIGVATALVLAACVMLMAGEARGAPRELAPMKAAEAREGTLLFRSDAKSETLAAPLLSTDLAAPVPGLVGARQGKQTFPH